MSLLRSLIPFRLSHLLETLAHASIIIIVLLIASTILYANLFDSKFYTLDDRPRCGAAHGAAGSSTGASAYAHAQLSALGRTCIVHTG